MELWGVRQSYTTKVTYLVGTWIILKSWGDKSSIVFNKKYGREYKVSTHFSDKTQLSISLSSSSQGFTLLNIRLNIIFNFLLTFFKLFFYFLLKYSWLANIVLVSGDQWRDSVIYTQFSPKFHSHPGCHITLSRVPSAYNSFLLVIHFKYSSVYMSIPNSLTILSPHTSPWQP